MSPNPAVLTWPRPVPSGATSDLTEFSWVWRFEADSITGVSDGGTIATWADTSGNSRNAAQSNAGLRPLFDVDAFNGGTVPGVYFTGPDKSLQTAAITALTQPTTIWVVSSGLPAANRILVDGITSTNRHLLYRSTTGASRMFAGSDVTLTNVAYATAGIVAAKFDGASSQIWLNGSATDALSVGNQTLTGLSIGNAYAAGFTAQQTYGAVLVTNAAQSAADMNTVGNYLADKFGYTWTDI